MRIAHRLEEPAASPREPMKLQRVRPLLRLLRPHIALAALVGSAYSPHSPRSLMPA